MGIFDRLSTLFRSNINDLISRAENPEKMLNQLIVDMRGQLAKAKQQVAAAIADEKRLSSQVDQEKKSAEDWERRGVLAGEGGRGGPAQTAPARAKEAGAGAGAAARSGGERPLGAERLVKQSQAVEGKADADQQLLALKRKLGLPPAGSPAESKQLGKGAAEAELVEDDDAEHHR